MFDEWLYFSRIKKCISLKRLMMYEFWDEWSVNWCHNWWLFITSWTSIIFIFRVSKTSSCRITEYKLLIYRVSLSLILSWRIRSIPTTWNVEWNKLNNNDEIIVMNNDFLNRFYFIFSGFISISLIQTAWMNYTRFVWIIYRNALRSL